MIIILYLLLMGCILASKPRMHLDLIQEDYLSRTRTCCINGIFISLVFISHVMMKSSGELSSILYELVPVKYINWPLEQLVVSTFFLYSGYGIMLSIELKDDYVKSIVHRRFPMLWLHFALATLLYFLLELTLGHYHSVRELALAVIGWETIGNPNWFITITLILYIFIFFSFSTCRNRLVAIHVHLLLSIALIAVLSPIKDFYWCNTLLCMNAGMLLFHFRKKIEHALRHFPLRPLYVGLILAGAGFILRYVFTKSTLPVFHDILAIKNILVNITAILFAVGVTIIQGCCNMKPCRFLVWAGGAALFPIYMYQMIPMNLCVHFHVPEKSASLYVLTSFLATIALAACVIPLYEKIDSRLFPSLRKKPFP